MSNRADQNTGIEAPGTSGHAFNTALDALELANNPFDIIEISRTFQGTFGMRPSNAELARRINAINTLSGADRTRITRILSIVSRIVGRDPMAAGTRLGNLITPDNFVSRFHSFIGRDQQVSEEDVAAQIGEDSEFINDFDDFEVE